MSEPSVRDVGWPNIRGSIYTYEKAGDVLPWHTHDEASAHIILCCKGLFYIEVGKEEDGKRVITSTHYLNPGQCLDTPPFMFHEVTAREAGSKAWHLIKGI